MTLMYLALEEKKPLAESAPRGLKFFAAAGFMNFLSYAFAYTALSMERVSIISPLINGSSLFVLPLSGPWLTGAWAVMWAAVVLTVATGVDYVVSAIRDSGGRPAGN